MNGILLLNKPKGLTSHDCVFKVRKLIKMKKVGHTGTLDPDVTGVLPICIGRATKIVEYITDADKTYEGEVTLGFTTTTEDASGDIVKQANVDRVITKSEIESVFSSLTGEITQTPPMYSAVKVNGKRLYEYARQGIEVERPSRQVTIKELVMLTRDETFEGEIISFRFRVTCSKGTYVRTLAVMMGELLGFPAHMSDLQRVASAGFTLEQCLSFEEIESKISDNGLDASIHTIESALSHLPKYQINDKVAEKVKNGAILQLPESLEYLQSEEPIVIINDKGLCIAIYERYKTKPHLMKPVKVLINNQELG